MHNYWYYSSIILSLLLSLCKQNSIFIGFNEGFEAAVLVYNIYYVDNINTVYIYIYIYIIYYINFKPVIGYVK